VVKTRQDKARHLGWKQQSQSPTQPQEHLCWGSHLTFFGLFVFSPSVYYPTKKEKFDSVIGLKKKDSKEKRKKNSHQCEAHPTVPESIVHSQTHPVLLRNHFPQKKVGPDH
jgi:hypothetical protein